MEEKKPSKREKPVFKNNKSMKLKKINTKIPYDKKRVIKIHFFYYFNELYQLSR